MRKNFSVAANDWFFNDGEPAVVTTCILGRVARVSLRSVNINGFTEDDLLAPAHNIVRHLDLPFKACTDSCSTLKKGKQ